jgi:hypothetical protein
MPTALGPSSGWLLRLVFEGPPTGVSGVRVPEHPDCRGTPSPGWQRRVRIASGAELVRLVTACGFDVLDDRLSGASLTLLLRAGTPTVALAMP